MIDFLNKSYSLDFYVKTILIAVAFLCTIGLVSIYSTTSASNIDAGVSPYQDVLLQIAAIFIGVIVACVLSKTPQVYNWQPILIYGIWTFCFLLVVAVPLVGVEVNGAKRWLHLVVVTIQPSEFMKIAIVAMTVKIFSEYSRGETTQMQALAQFSAFAIMPLVFMFVTQRDMGTTMVCCIVLIAVAYMAGFNPKIIGAILATMIVVVIIYLNFGGDYRSQRLSFLNPWDDGQGGYGAGYNLIRAFYAIASGGLFGVGIGNSHEKYDYLYASDNDFIFAIICEEGGLVSGLVLIIAICVLYICALKIADQLPSEEQKLIVYGAVFLLVFQSFLNIGCTVGALPTTGKPLPFVSSGGTSVVASFICLGLILNAVYSEPVRTVPERKRDKLEVISSSRRQTTRAQRSSFLDLEDRPQSKRYSNRSRGSNLDFVSSFDRSRQPDKRKYR